MANGVVTEARAARIQDGLLHWFKFHARDLPWRRTRDPYAILVSEVMLQQTQVDRVIPYFHRFLERFPTVRELAEAPTADVIRIWSGLGYNRRAVSLQRAAQAVISEHEGVFPSEPEALRQLPGIGAYTAGAVAAFAFERDAAFLDTNMRRVLNRLAFGLEPGPESKNLELAAALVPAGKGWEWNQALIEFGALQCTARRPACIVCPLREDCAAFPAVQSVTKTQRGRSTGPIIEPFETTSRYYRGRIVHALRELPEHDQTGIDLAQLGTSVRDGFTHEHVPWLRGLVEGLQRDGLAVICEDSPPYDASEASEQSRIRVRLP